MNDFLWLKFISNSAHFGDCFCRVLVERQWLNNQIAAANGGAVRLRITSSLMNRWLNQLGSFPHPILRTFGINVGISVGNLNNPTTKDFSVSVVGTLGTEVNIPSIPPESEIKVTVLSGAIRLWSQQGFDQILDILGDDPNSPGNQVRQLLDTVWPQTVVSPRSEVVSALYFGADALQMELLQRNRGNRKLRLEFELVKPSTDGQTIPYRLWRVVACDDAPNLVSADVVIQKEIERLENSLAAPASNRPPLDVRILRSQVGLDEPEMYFRVDPNTPPQSLMRLGIQLVFSTSRGETAWVPANLNISTNGNTTDYRFSDFDAVKAWLTGTVIPSIPADDRRAQANWVIGGGENVDLAYSRPMYGRGITAGRLKKGYLWQLANVPTRRRVAGGFDVGELELPVWVRYHFDEDSSSGFDPLRRMIGLSGPLVVERKNADGIVAEIDIAQPRTATTPLVEYVFRLTRTGLTDQLSSIVLTASVTELRIDTPQHLHVYSGEMIDPASPPNLKVLSTENNGNLQLTGLTFSDRTISRSPVRDFAPLQLILESGLRHHFECPGTSWIDNVAAFVPHEDAIVQYLTPSRFNLETKVDPDSGRAVVPRDVNHGLVVWRLANFTISAPSSSQLARVVPQGGTLQPRDMDGCLALAPWVEVRDPTPRSSGSQAYNIYHRNLVQEHGEFASAAEDRALGDQPVVVPGSVDHFLNSVRDAYAMSGARVERGSVDLINWLPGARLQNEQGTAIAPQLSLEVPQRVALSPVRFPRVTVNEFANQALFIPEPKPWLEVYPRWIGDPDESAVNVELLPNDSPKPGYARWENSAGPLLFYQSHIGCVNIGVGANGESTLIAGHDDGTVVAWQAADGQSVPHRLGRQTSNLLAVSIAEYHGEPHALLILANGVMRLLKFPGGENVTELNHGRPLDAASIFVGEAGGSVRWMAAIADDLGAIHIVDALTGTILADLPGTASTRSNAVDFCIATMSNGQPQAVVGSVLRSGLARVWLWSTGGTTTLPLTVPELAVSISVAPNGADIDVATGYSDNTIRLWSIQNNVLSLPEEFPVARTAPTAVSSVAIRRRGTVREVAAAVGADLFVFTNTVATTLRRPILCGKTLTRLQWNRLAIGETDSDLLSTDADENVRLWDTSIPRENRCFYSSRKCLDNLGVVRPVASAATPNMAIVEPRRYPALESNARETGSKAIRSYSYFRTAPLLDDEAKGDFVHFGCDGLKLVEVPGQHGVFVPWDDATNQDPFANPTHRGHAGVFGIFAAKSNFESAKSWPVIKHVPLYPVRIDQMTFEDDDDEPLEIRFTVVMANPTELTQTQAECVVPDFVSASLARNAVVQIVLERNSDGAFQLSAAHTRGTIDWTFGAEFQKPVDYPIIGLPARLDRIVGDIFLDGDQWIINTKPDRSEAYALGCQSALAGPSLQLRSSFRGGVLNFALTQSHRVPTPEQVYGVSKIPLVPSYLPPPSVVAASIENGQTVRLWDAELGLPFATLTDSHTVTHVETIAVPVRAAALSSASFIELIDLDLEQPQVVSRIPLHAAKRRSILIEKGGTLSIASADVSSVSIGTVGEPSRLQFSLPPHVNTDTVLGLDVVENGDSWDILVARSGVIDFLPRVGEAQSLQVPMVTAVRAKRISSLNLLFACIGNTIRSWSIDLQSTHVDLPIALPASVTQMDVAEFNRGGSTFRGVLASMPSQPIHFYDANSGALIHVFTDGEMGLFVSRGETADILIVSRGEAKVFDCESFVEKSSFPVADEAIVSLTACSPLSIHAVTAANDFKVRIWDARSGVIRRELDHPQDVTSLAVGLYDGLPHLATGCADGFARVWSLTENLTPRLLDHGGSPVTCLAFGAICSTSYLWTGAMKQLRAWNGNVPHEYSGLHDQLTAIAFVDDFAGPILVTGTVVGEVGLWNGLISDSYTFISNAGSRVISLSGSFDGHLRLLIGLSNNPAILLSGFLDREGETFVPVRLAEWSFGQSPNTGDAIVDLMSTRDGTRALIRSRGVCSQWVPSPDLWISSSPSRQLRCRLPLAWPQSSQFPQIKLRASLTPGFQLALQVTTARLIPSLGTDTARSWPVLIHGTWFGFSIGKMRAGQSDGLALLGLTVESTGSGMKLRGLLLTEETDSARIQVHETSGNGLLDFEGSRVRLWQTFFTLTDRAPIAIKEWAIESAHLAQVAHPETFLHWSDQWAVKGNGSDAPLTAILSWKRNTENLQAIVRLRRQSDGKYRFDGLVHYRKLVTIDSTAISQAGPVIDSDGEQLTRLEAHVTNRVREGNNSEPMLVQLEWTSGNVRLRRLPWDTIPVHPCLDADTYSVIPVLTAKRPQLSHHVGVGLLLRQELPSNIASIDVSQATIAPMSLPDEHLFLLDPIVGNHILTQDIALKAAQSSNEPVRTENLIAIRADAAIEPLRGLYNQSKVGSTESLIEELAIDEQIRLSGESGFIVQRTRQDSGPAEFRFVRSPLAPNAGTSIDTTFTGSQGTTHPSLDIRLMPPLEMLRWRLVPGTYFRTPIEEHLAGRVLPERARRLRFRRPPRVHAGDPTSNFPSVRQQLYEATAFDQMSRLWHLPANASDFQPISDSDDFRPFLPHYLEITYAPDKPGAMIHHSLVSTTFDQDHYKREPLLESALRDPQQVVPPIGSSIKLEPLAAPSLDRGCNTWLLKWKEVLGQIELTAPDDNLALEQFSLDPPKIRLRDGAVPFRLIVQINEDLFEIDAAEQAIPFNQRRDRTLVPPRLFLVSKIANVLDPITFSVDLPAPHTPVGVTLTPSLVTDGGGDPLSLSALFEPVPRLDSDPDLGGYFLFQLKEGVFPSPPTDALSRNVQYWFAWKGALTNSEFPPTGAALEAIVFGEAGKKGLKGIPFMLTPPKIVAVACADTIDAGNHKEALQRTVLFGDAADPKTGRGVLLDATPENIRFQYEIPDQETLTVPSPLKPRIDSWEFILIRHSSLGSVVYARASREL